MGRGFEQRLSEALADPYLKHIPITSLRIKIQDELKTLTESKTPQSGIYYWIPFGNGQWHIESFWFEFHEGTVHYEIWKKYIVPLLKSNFNFKEDIAGLYHGLPRGRIIKNDSGQMVVLHGGDSPVAHWQEVVVSEFNLPPNTEFVEVDHEKMNLKHKEVLIGVLKE